MFWIASDCRVKPRSPLLGWMSGDWPVTVMFSSSFPISRVKLPAANLSLAFTTKSGLSALWKPSRVILSV